jgi:hypothetical protein
LTYRSATSHQVDHRFVRIVEKLLGSAQVEDVHAVAYSVDVAAHLGVPSLRGVAEVDPGFEQLAQ